MSANARHYRDHIYKMRAHPEAAAEAKAFSDGRDSFAKVYVSLAPFLALEYFTELKSDSIVSGLMFPTGYLLFWAFYYTYYRPGILEEKLSTTARPQLGAILALIFGVTIWFVKVSIVEVGEILLFQRKREKPRPRPAAATSSKRPATPPPLPGAARVVRPARPSDLPREVLIALTTLGLGDCRDWKEIHHRYRELAKRTHPDLNPNNISAGREFMLYDSAYRRLLSVKDRYFQEKRSSG